MSAEAETWQLAGSAPELYERYLVPAVTLPWAQDLVARVGIGDNDHVLDVACGTGVVARLAAVRVGPAGRVVGLDMNTGMLEVARTTPRAPDGRSVEWIEGSALALPFADGEFGIVVCQLGLQFFEDRLRALQEMRRVLGAGGRVGASVFTAIDRNPAAHALSDALERAFGEGASLAKRGEHALADAEELRELCAGAGLVGVRVETVTKTIHFPSVHEWVRIQLAATPLAALLLQREPSERDRLVAGVSADVGVSLARFEHDGGFAFPQEVHVVLANANDKEDLDADHHRE